MSSTAILMVTGKTTVQKGIIGIIGIGSPLYYLVITSRCATCTLSAPKKTHRQTAGLDIIQGALKLPATFLHKQNTEEVQIGRRSAGLPQSSLPLYLPRPEIVPCRRSAAAFC